MSSERQRGQVLLVALVVLLLTSIAAALLASSLVVRLRMAREEAIEIHLQALTDAAMAKALASLARDASFSGFALEPLEGDSGSIWSRVEPLVPPRVVLLAGATYGDRLRSVRAEVLVTSGPPRVVSWAATREQADGSAR